MRAPLKAAAAVGGFMFAAAGALMGSMNAGWFGLERNSNSLFPLLGVGGLMVAAGWVGSESARQLWVSARFARAAAALVIVGGLFFLLNPVLQFAILGTLSFGLGLTFFAAMLWRQRLMASTDRAMATLAAVGSLTWNTETLSAFLLVAVGLLLAALSLRMDFSGAR